MHPAASAYYTCFRHLTFTKRPVRPLVSSTGPPILVSSTPTTYYTLPWFVLFLNMPPPPDIPSTKSWLIGLSPLMRFACCVILQQWKLSHDELLQESGLPTLAKRCDVATLCHLFKFFHGLCSSPNLYKPHPRPSLCHLNSCAVDPPPILPLVAFQVIFLPIRSFNLELLARSHC